MFITKKVKITIPSSAVLKKIKNIPSIKNLSRIPLVVGDNFEVVNEYQLNKQKKLFPLYGIEVKEI